MKSIREILPRASQDCIDLNPLSSPSETIKTSSTGNGEVRKVRRGAMNKTEREFSLILEAQRRRGEVQRWEYEGTTLRWADMKYTPDFIAFDTTSSAWLSKDFPEIKIIRGIRLIEVKGGHIWDRDIVRFKGARAYWPEFQFEMWQKKKGQWTQLF